MNELNLSKSKYCRGVQCKKMLWLDKNKPDEAIDKSSESTLENGIKVGELARGLFGKYDEVAFNKDLSIMIDDTKELIKHGPNVIAEASFEFEKNFCSVDILKNSIYGLEIYEVKSSAEVKSIYIDDVSYQTYILRNLGFKINSVNIVYINNQYERHGELEIDKLFNIENVTDIAFSKQDEIKEKINELRAYMKNNDEQDEKIGMQCFEPYECAFWEHCTKDLPENNVFKIRGMFKKQMFSLYYDNVITFEDICNHDVNEKYIEQAEVEITGVNPEIHVDEIREFMKEITYPLYFLDFETFQQPIPEYDGIKPYMQIPFQYSLHYIEYEGGPLMHKEFLAQPNMDPRRDLAEALVNDIPKNVCVTAYNMGFEKGRIKELASLYSDLSEHLMNIHENIRDLMIPFFKRWYYTKEMQGSYSIKYVLPALFPNDPELDYHNLPVVHNGSEASATFIDLPNHSKEEQEEIRNGLLVYCKLDTYAMVKVWEKLKEVIE